MGLCSCGGSGRPGGLGPLRGSPTPEASASEAESSPEPGGEPGAQETSDPEAEELLSRVEDAVAEVSSVQMTGRMESQGAVVEIDTVADADSCRQTMTHPLVGVVDIVRLGDEAWIMPPDASWLATENGADAAAEYAGSYVHGPADSPEFAELTSGCALPGSFGVLHEGGEEAVLTMGEETALDGAPALTVEQSLDSEFGPAHGTLLVAAEGEPYPLQSTFDMSYESLGGISMTLTQSWSGFNRPVTVSAPAAGETVELAELAPGDNPFPLDGSSGLPLLDL
ncbi:hypothetical protein D7294_29180 [Streptomyces hoynatensis]|uniref:LppX_LprAFG lipoprotein n=1 Tax=Streptomyces hoynatensis TaxID=1141874 RepID=A0A3A9YPB5_9ACTN|nr:hypothetical protein D7294_29180 [Streptomyces hoynatensis]